MILVGKTSVDTVNVGDVESISYFNLSEDQKWKISHIQEIINAKVGNLDIPGFEFEELETIISHFCTE